MRIDHLAIACQTLAEGVTYAEQALGLPLPPAIGQHPLMGTHNRLLSLGGAEYLEIIAIDPAAPPPGRARWFGLDGFSGPPRIQAWICAEDASLGQTLAEMRQSGAGEIIDFQRGPYQWQMAVPDSGLLPFDGLQPAQILWQSSPPALDLPTSPCRLERLILSHPQPEALAQRLTRLNDPRLQIGYAPQPQIRAEIRSPQGLCLL